jgi:O-antigen/teichoic acid export membrane protein
VADVEVTAEPVVRSAIRLTIARQVAALILMCAVLVLPRLVSREVFDGFMWLYFSVLFLSSILNLGLERAVAPVINRAGDTGPPGAATPLLLARFVTLPLTALSLTVLLRVVGVQVPFGAWCAGLVWVFAVQVQGVPLAALRATSTTRLEAVAAVVSRTAQGLSLLLLAWMGAGLTSLVGALAAIEVAATLVVTGAMHVDWRQARQFTRDLPWRLLVAYTAVELVAFSYLRVDTVIVGAIVGPSAGATYTLVYRVVDALVALATPSLLLLFPRAVSIVASGGQLDALRRRTGLLVPRLALLVAVATMIGCGLVARSVPRFDEGLETLRLLIVSVPLYLFSATELHLRSAEDRNGQVLWLGLATLCLNVALNIWFVHALGLPGAAWALIVAETLQVVALGTFLRLRGTPQRPVAVVLGGTAVTLAMALLLNAGYWGAGAVLAAGLVAVTTASLTPAATTRLAVAS